MSFVDFKNIFTEMEICHLGPESLKTESCIRHREPWAAAVAHRQWRKGFNAGGCVNPSKHKCYHLDCNCIRMGKVVYIT
jgi:hypothetical protein